MNLPPFFYVRKFWEGVALLLSGVCALLVGAGVLPEQYLLGAGVILTFLLAALRWFGVIVELRMRK
jgi:NhaP-type Na+/H+ or K+/H+ antiporter